MPPRRRSSKGAQTLDPATAAFWEATAKLGANPVFAPLLHRANTWRREGGRCPKDPEAWAVVTSTGEVHPHPTRRGDPAEWVYALAHCLLHLGLGHFAAHERPDHRERWAEWCAACDVVVARFLADVRVGRPITADQGQGRAGFPTRTEEQLFEEFCANGIPERFRALGVAGGQQPDMVVVEEKERRSARARKLGPRWGTPDDWRELFGRALADAVTSAVHVAAGYEPPSPGDAPRMTLAQRARAWFVNSYPLLGALAAAFRIVEDPLACIRQGISVAAVNVHVQEIYVNPAAGLPEDECRFVMAHELLHVGLRHDARCQGRDPYLWNVACDYVINGWLVEMGLGTIPTDGALYDPSLKGLSAESIYDRIVTDVRRYRKLATLRGVGLGDIIQPDPAREADSRDPLSLDEFYRRCLAQGLAYHEAEGRGLLPSGLVEEIRALGQPPIPWDVELAKWFDEHFAPIEQVRSYARPSRRQSSTPDIPRPRWVPARTADDGRTFGVVLDTSGSMDRVLLAKALGAIASYSIARDVPAVRVVFCDAAAYDQGYLPPEAIAGSIKVRGRGGTVLQPGIDILERATDFPKDGPILVITDGQCDRFRLRRDHAILLPKGHHLPFVPNPTAKVFRLS